MKQASSYCSYVFYDDTESSPQMGTLCFVECNDKIFRLNKVNWGAKEDYDRSSDGEVELSWTVDGEDYVRLKKVCSSSSPDQLVQFMQSKFAHYNRLADHYLLQWLEQHHIATFFYAYY